MAGERVVIGGNLIDRAVRWTVTVWFGLVIAMPYLIFGSPLSSSAFDGLLQVVNASTTCVGALGIYAVWRARVQLTADLRTRTYLWERGIKPLLSRREGSLEEFSHLSFRSVMHIGHGGSFPSFYLSLERNDGGRKRPSFWYSHTVYTPNAKELAEKLGLAIEYGMEG